ncbi:malonic semialdehyde reductase [Paraburkholderia sediminicola]|uniref:malonic semialdehyde reductase n=1 Tax=Paraburkholderia sediminicola TaxID=458836 RepID=UPI0038B70F92
MLSDEGLNLLFHEARTYNGWQSKQVTEQTLRQLYDTLKLAPTSANSSPGRFVFVSSAAAKARLIPCLAPQNIDKVRTAPVTVIVGYDTDFPENMKHLFPHRPEIAGFFRSDERLLIDTARRNATLQGAYLILAARALGLDCGPLSGFDNAKVDAEFFQNPGSNGALAPSVKSEFLCNLGYGDSASIFERLPRLSWGSACTIL